MMKEYKAISSLAVIMAMRMMGLFMILPVFSIYANEYTHVNTQLMGIALGIYGLTQGLLQLPFGMLSDRLGRKPVIAMGLYLFILGSVYAAMAHSIYGIIIGRALQGTGAIGSTILATVADLSRDESRSRVMGIMGLAVGGSFAIAMIVGPWLVSWVGLSGIFWVTAGMALIGILLLLFTVPTPPRWVQANSPSIQAKKLRDILKDTKLLRLDVSIFLLHATLTALFVVIPIILTRQLHLPPTEQIELYVGVLALAFVFMLPFLILAEKKRAIKKVFIGAIIALLLSQLLLWRFHSHLLAFGGLLLIFFMAFSLLEAVLPSWVSKLTPILNKGSALGIYSTAQFLGIFVGGSLAGWVLTHWGLEAIFCLGAGFAGIWLCLVFSLADPPYLSTVSFPLALFGADNDEKISSQFGQMAGIMEVAIVKAEALIYFKIDQQLITKSQLRHFLEKSKLVASHEVSQGVLGQ